MEQCSLFDYIPETKTINSTDWKWSFKDYPSKNGLTVFSLFAGGGGSTMGYKLAGCDVLGCCEIDALMNKIYVNNHNPKYNYLMDIRDFNKLDNLPKELYNLDILDGSPPCSTFSMAGQRENSWGVEKTFKEGQKLQTLDDLPFEMIKTVDKLRPKVVLMENVEGLLFGRASEYVKQIYYELNKIGYSVRHQIVKGEYMGVPQKRHRVIFIATRLNYDINKIDLNFNYNIITYGQIKDGIGSLLESNTHTSYIVDNAIATDKRIADTSRRLGEKISGFQSYYIRDDEVIPTIRSQPYIIDVEHKSIISKETIRNAQTFPQDFDFGNNTYFRLGYVCGMSVPPVMIKRVVERIINSGIFEKE